MNSNEKCSVSNILSDGFSYVNKKGNVKEKTMRGSYKKKAKEKPHADTDHTHPDQLIVPKYIALLYHPAMYLSQQTFSVLNALKKKQKFTVSASPDLVFSILLCFILPALYE